LSDVVSRAEEYDRYKITLGQIELEGQKLLDPSTVDSSDKLQFILDRYGDGKAVCILCGLAGPDTECHYCETWSWHAACAGGVEVPCLLHMSTLWIRLLAKYQSMKCQTCVWKHVRGSEKFPSNLQYCGRVLKKNHESLVENTCIFSVSVSDAVETGASWQYPMRHTLFS
jgi:hypothetical protein